MMSDNGTNEAGRSTGPRSHRAVSSTTVRSRTTSRRATRSRQARSSAIVLLSLCVLTTRRTTTTTTVSAFQSSLGSGGISATVARSKSFPLVEERDRLFPSSSSSSSRALRRLNGSSSKDGEDETFDRSDPNPGGANDYQTSRGGDGDGAEREEGFLAKIQNLLRSEEVKEDVRIYTFSLCIALLLRFFIIEPRFIPSLSMYPTFDVGDQLAVEKVTKRIRPFFRNEVVVFNPPPAFQQIVTNSKGKEALIKRIVATEGDKVEVRNGKLYVNDAMQDEPFTNEDANYAFGPVVVPPGDVLVLGDNRNHSLDGHVWGFLPKGNIIGRAVFIYWPPWRVGNSGMF